MQLPGVPQDAFVPGQVVGLVGGVGLGVGLGVGVAEGGVMVVFGIKNEPLTNTL